MDINLWAVLAASVAHMVLGYTWYHPRVFGAAWMRLTQVTPEMTHRGNMMVTMALVFASAVVMAAVLAYVKNAGGFFGIAETIGLSVVLWLGFIAPVLLGSVLWDQKPVKLYLLNAGYWLVSLMVMGIILALLP